MIADVACLSEKRTVSQVVSKGFGSRNSLSIAIVTSDGVLFEKNWGVIRGNESATSPPTTSHSQYRIASVSKLFTALEGLILEERGIISWCVLRPHVMLRTTNS